MTKTEHCKSVLPRPFVLGIALLHLWLGAIRPCGGALLAQPGS